MTSSKSRSGSSGSIIGRREFIVGASAVALAACTDETDEGANSGDESTTVNSTNETSVGSAPSSTSGAEPPPDPTTADDQAIDELSPAMFAALPTCILTEPAGEGPFPSKAPLLRREIHESLPGHPLRIGIRVVDEACEPVPGATVDIWHTDASGDYSEYADNGSGKDEGEGSTFCRGAQTSNADGILEFLSIYPGWYDGRTVHIHATVRIDDQRILTTQLYLDESLTAAVHQEDAYAQFGPQDTSWDEDSAIGDPTTDGSLLQARPSETTRGTGTLALINLGVDVS